MASAEAVGPTTVEGAAPVAPSSRNSMDAVTRNVDKDKIIEQLANEKQLLVWKVGELEEIIEGLKTKTENLEGQVESLTQANTAMKEKLATPRRLTYLGNHVIEPPEECRKKKPSLPPPPIPTQMNSPPQTPTQVNSPPPTPTQMNSPSQSSTPSPCSSPEPLSPGQTSVDEPMWSRGIGGWNSGVRPESMVMQDRAKASSSFALNHSASLNNLPSLPASYVANFTAAKSHDSTRRSKTSPIPAPSPCIYGSRAVSLSSPAFPDTELSMPSSPEPWTDGEVEDEADPDLVWDKKEDGRRFVKGGTLEKLVERLTYDRAPETNYVNSFLLTYKSFTTPMELLDKLIARYNIEPSEELTGDALTLFERRKKIIQLRVGNVIKTWVDKHFHDFEKDPALTASVSKFVENQLEVDMVTIGKTITKLLTQTRGTLSLTFSTSPPAVMIPKTSDFLDFDPLEVARQLTIIEYDLYKGIEAKECLNQAWSGTHKEANAPHIVAMIKRFNLVSTWVATEIVNTEKLTDRVMKVKKFLNIAKMCRDIGNFNGIMEILAGLQNSSIHRLKRTWEKVLSKAKYDDLYNNLLMLMSNNNNFRDYRAALHNCQPPCIPYLGVFLTDLTFIEDGTKDVLNGRDDLIHFEKRRKVSLVIRDIQQYQQAPYNYSPEVTIKDALITLQSMDENTLFNISMQCEPRETEEMRKERKEREKKDAGTYSIKMKDLKEMSMASLSFLKDFNFTINK